MSHDMFNLGKEIGVSLHRCEPGEGYKEPLCIVAFNFTGGSSQQIMISTEDLKFLGRKIDQFTRGI